MGMAACCYEYEEAAAPAGLAGFETGMGMYAGFDGVAQRNPHHWRLQHGFLGPRELDLVLIEVMVGTCQDLE